MRQQHATNSIPHCPRKAGVRSFGCHARFFTFSDRPSAVSAIPAAHEFDRPVSHATSSPTSSTFGKSPRAVRGEGRPRGVGRFLLGLARFLGAVWSSLFSLAPTVDQHRPRGFSIPTGTRTRRLIPVMERQ